MSASETDWSRYLESVCEEYAHWWEKYTLTDVTGRQQQAASKGGVLLLDLIAETVPENDEGDPQPDKQTEEIERFTVLEGLRKYAERHVLLQGAPGSGKSTAMARLLLEEAERARDEQSCDGLATGKDAVEQKTLKIPVPVLVELRYYDQSLQQLIKDSVQRRDPSLAVSELEQWLNQGQLLLLLDGVNELPSEEARQDVRRFRLRYEKTTPMVFTTRKLGEGGDLSIGKKLTMQPLSEAQMRDFVQAYLPGQGKAMLTQLGNRLREFGAVPLLLWMLCSVYASNQQQIPANLGEFFRRFTQLYDDKLKRDVPDANKSKLLWPEILQELAFRMMVGRGTAEALVAIPRTEAVDIIRSFCQEVGEKGSLAQAKLWLEDLLKYHLIQVGTTDSIQFRHQLIQEYYAAEKLLRLLPNIIDEELQWQYLNFLKWTEPFILIAGLLENKQLSIWLVHLALELDYELGARLSGAVPEAWQIDTIKSISTIDIPLILKTQLYSKTHSVSVVSELLSALKDSNLDVRKRAVEVLGELGDVSAIPELLRGLQDESWLVRSCAVTALCKIGKTFTFVSPKILSMLCDDTAEVRRSAVNALGEIGDKSATADLLSAFFSDEDLSVRYGAAEALGKIGDFSLVERLLSFLDDADNLDRRVEVAYALGEIGSDSAINALLQLLFDDDVDVCDEAAYALYKIGDTSVVERLLDALDDDNPYIRWEATYALSKIGNSSAVERLLSALNDDDSRVRFGAAYALGQIGNKSAVIGLLSALRDNNVEVRFRTAYALGQIGEKSAVPGLLEALSDNDIDVRRNAAEALGQIGDESSVVGLLNALKDDDLEVRFNIVEALRKIKSTSAVKGLLSVLVEDDEWVRSEAAEALIQIGGTSAIVGALEVLKNASSEVRRSAVYVLGEICEFLPREGLINSLRDNDSSVRTNAARALGNIGESSAVTELIISLKDSDSYVRESAAKALGNIGESSAVTELMISLKDNDSRVCGSAVEALGKIGDRSAVIELLRVLYEDEWFKRHNAVEALVQIGDVSTTLGLMSALDATSVDVRRSAAYALGRIGSSLAVECLLETLSDVDPEVRGSAAYALGRIGNALAVEELLSSLKDDDWSVRKNALKALEEIQDDVALTGLMKSLKNRNIDTLETLKALKRVQGNLGYYRPYPATHREVFISYAWDGESETVAIQLDKAFQAQGINIIRDKKDAGYKANIRDFMQQISQGKCVLVVISDKYLKSENCMFELVEIAKNGDVCDRIFPIVLSDANIYKATARLKYIQYWEQQIEELETDMKAGGLANLQGITNDLNLYTEIRNSIASLTDTLKNMNTLTPDMHRDSNFEIVIEAVKAKLAE